MDVVGAVSSWLFFQARAVKIEVQVFSKMVDGEMSMSVGRCLDDPLESESGLIHPHGSDSEIWISEKCVRWYWSKEHPNVIPVCKCKAKAILSYMLLLILINHKHDASLPSPVPRTPILTFPYPPPPPFSPPIFSHDHLPPQTHSRNIKKYLQLLNQQPLLLADIVAIIFLQRIYTLPADQGVQNVFLVQLAAVERLVGAFDLNGYGGLSFFADGDLFVVALDGGARVGVLVRDI